LLLGIAAIPLSRRYGNEAGAVILEAGAATLAPAILVDLVPSALEERGVSMKWQFIVAGALAALFGTLFIASMASADVRIISDPGGEVSSYRRTFYEMRSSEERIVIDGPCLSACTLLTGIVPRHHVCVTKRAVLGFHAASYYNDVSGSLTPTRAGTRFLMRLYPPEIRAWINRRGGLSPQLIRMRGRDLAALYSPCP
jgi:hypothetical protein